MAVAVTPVGAGDRRIVLGVVLCAAGATFCGASLNYVIRPIVTSLQATETQGDLLRQLPGMGGVLAIFVAGALIGRLGARRCLVWAGVLMCLGYFVTCVATSMGLLAAGLLAAYVGNAAVIVVAVSVLGSAIRGRDARASAFASLAMVSPAVCVVIPVLAGYLVDTVGWRAVAGVWLFGAAVVVLAALALIPRPETHVEGERGELWTPVLSGVVLVGLTQLVRLVPVDGLTGARVLLMAGVTVGALVALLVLMWRLPEPTMSFRVLRRGGLLLLIVVMLFVPFSNMWFYGTVGAQYVYGLSALAVALLFVPVQLAGVFGARLSGRLVQAKGLTFSGTAGLLGAAAMLFLCTLQTTTITIIFPVVVLMVYCACISGAVGTVTNAVMSMAAPGEEGEASAFRSAATSLGSSLGAVFLSAAVFSAMSAAMTDQSSAAGLDPQQSEQIARSMLDGATSEEVASQYSVPLATVDEIQGFQQQAFVAGYWAQGVAGGIVVTLSGLLYLVACRRIRRQDPDWGRR